MLKHILDVGGSRRDVGLLIIRLVIGFTMAAFHGWGKLTGGPESWERIGGTMSNLGIDVLPVFWGFMAAFAEFFGSVLIALGVAFRPALILVIATMTVAAIRHLSLPPDAEGAGLRGAAHALELLAVYVGLWFTGPGRWRLGRW